MSIVDHTSLNITLTFDPANGRILPARTNPGDFRGSARTARVVEKSVERSFDVLGIWEFTGGTMSSAWAVMLAWVENRVEDEEAWFERVQEEAAFRRSYMKMRRGAGRAEAQRGWRDGRDGRPKGGW